MVLFGNIMNKIIHYIKYKWKKFSHSEICPYSFEMKPILGMGSKFTNWDNLYDCFKKKNYHKYKIIRNEYNQVIDIIKKEK